MSKILEGMNKSERVFAVRKDQQDRQYRMTISFWEAKVRQTKYRFLALGIGVGIVIATVYFTQ